jgi:NAD(P)-dependent dehydrogenase (short-subunit alcohol dehydrogenase family)
MFDLTGRLALVTGAGQGVGAGIARALASQGARVLVNDIDAARAEKSAATNRERGDPAFALPFDVTDRDAVVAALVPHPVDILVNNAGNAGATRMVPRPFREMDPSEWDAPIAVNMTGVMNTTHAVLPGMCERGFGRLITIASGAGVIGLPIGVSPYGAAKGAGISFMRHMAIENAAFGVTANSLALGLMEMEGPVDRSVTEKMARQIPRKRLGTGNDVGPACVWLASDEATWVTGQTIHINGGSVTS